MDPNSLGIVSADFDSDTSKLVTTSWSKIAKVWDMATGEQLFTLTGHEGPVMYAAFNKSANRIITASMDETAKVWILP